MRVCYIRWDLKKNQMVKTRDQNKTIAVELASDIEKIQVLRKCLCNCLRYSRLSNGNEFTKTMVKVYRDMSRQSRSGEIAFIPELYVSKVQLNIIVIILIPVKMIFILI
jgi:hypothetical protein